METFPQRLQFFLETHRWTVTRLARQLGVSRATVSRWGSGAAAPNRDHARSFEKLSETMRFRQFSGRGFSDILGYLQSCEDCFYGEKHAGLGALAAYTQWVIFKYAAADRILTVPRAEFMYNPSRDVALVELELPASKKVWRLEIYLAAGVVKVAVTCYTAGRKTYCTHADFTEKFLVKLLKDKMLCQTSTESQT